MKKIGLCGAIASFALLANPQAHAVQTDHASHAEAYAALADLSLEELAGIKVISVSKVERPVSKVPASVLVVTESDIRRAGSTTLPEALRLAPNLQVARSGARNYAVTARGFNNVFANKMLVMIDGRTVYSPLFSGVYWDAQDVVLEDLDRIEVASGPGGTTWGANAVNGVINIVTRSAKETQGELVSLGASAHEQHATVRYGGSFDNGGHYRVYAKHGQHDDTFHPDGVSSVTGWHRTQTGFRADWNERAEAFTLQGDAYSGRLNQFGTDDIEISGANLLARKRWEFSPDSKLSVQGYFDHTERDQPTAFHQKLDAYDVDLQHEWTVSHQHQLIWGGGYRHMRDRIENEESFAFLPADLTLVWRNVFVQDEITLQENLRLILGVKMEDNPFTGWDVMPSAKFAWEPDNTKLVWTSVARAVRSPSRIDRDLYAPANPIVVDGNPQYFFAGGSNFVSEIADVFELGYRSQPIPSVSWSITGFYSEYGKLRTIEPNDHGSGFVIANMAEAETYGVEMWGSWQVSNVWRLHGGLVMQNMDVSLKRGSADISNTTALSNADPEYYGLLRSSHDLSNNVKLDITMRHVAELKQTDVPAYTAMDVNIAWAPTPHLTLSLVGQNLLDPSHPEFDMGPDRSEYERAFYAKLIWSH